MMTEEQAVKLLNSVGCVTKAIMTGIEFSEAQKSLFPRTTQFVQIPWIIDNPFGDSSLDSELADAFDLMAYVCARRFWAAYHTT
jgi:hypothetical protein